MSEQKKGVSVTELPRKVIARHCPGCGFVESQLGAELMSYNFSCPRCDDFKVSDFMPLYNGDNGTIDLEPKIRTLTIVGKFE